MVPRNEEENVVAVEDAWAAGCLGSRQSGSGPKPTDRVVDPALITLPIAADTCRHASDSTV